MCVEGDRECQSERRERTEAEYSYSVDKYHFLLQITRKSGEALRSYAHIDAFIYIYIYIYTSFHVNVCVDTCVHDSIDKCMYLSKFKLTCELMQACVCMKRWADEGVK